MSVTLMCPNLLCRKILMVSEEMRGQRVRCSYCGNVLLVPAKNARSYANKQGLADLVATKSSPDEKGKQEK